MSEFIVYGKNEQNTDNYFNVQIVLMQFRIIIKEKTIKFILLKIEKIS